MALNPLALKAEIKDIMDDMKTRNEDASDEFAERLANAIHDYVLGIQITYIAGLMAGSVPVTGVFQNQVS